MLPAGVRWQKDGARHLKGNEIEAYSAGIETHSLNQRMLLKLWLRQELIFQGIVQRHVNELKGIDFDYVVTDARSMLMKIVRYSWKAKVRAQRIWRSSKNLLLNLAKQGADEEKQLD